MVIGVVSEYNPFHLGHRKQFAKIREEFGQDCAIVCAMSGNYVQRGMPAIFDKSLRAEAALRCGADLVVELPVTAAVSSAEGFAAGGVAVLSRLCHVLCFGSETGSREGLMEMAQALVSPDFSRFLRQELDRGISFPAARMAALEQMGLSPEFLVRPNDILAVEYCKAILSQGSSLDIFPIHREGSYHALTPDAENPSATALRELLVSGGAWQAYVPGEARRIFEHAPLHTLAAGERSILMRLRTMTQGEFEALPFGSEGLWRKLMHLSRRENALEDIVQKLKSKRYTRTRLDRMILCACLGITAEDLAAPLPYARVLGFTHRGREILAANRRSGFFRNAGEPMDHPYQILENRCGDLYGLFALNGTESPGTERRRRVVYLQDACAAPIPIIKSKE